MFGKVQMNMSSRVKLTRCKECNILNDHVQRKATKSPAMLQINVKKGSKTKHTCSIISHNVIRSVQHAQVKEISKVT